MSQTPALKAVVASTILNNIQSEKARLRSARSVSPASLHCGRPYSLTYSAANHCDTGTELPSITSFVDSYNRACNGLLQLLKPYLDDEQYAIIIALLIMPSKVSQAVAESQPWAELVGSTEGNTKQTARELADPTRPHVTPRTWSQLNASDAYHLLLVLTDPAAADLATSRPARLWRAILAEFNLPIPALSAKKLEEVFGELLYTANRTEAANAVFACLRSLLSNRENAKAHNLERQAARQDAINRDPAFFKAFDSYCQDFRSWMRGCRHFAELRSKTLPTLKGSTGGYLPRQIVAACQRAAMLSSQAAHIRSWQRLKPLTDEDRAIAAKFENVTQAFIAQVPVETPNTAFEEDVFRRFARAQGHPKELARDVNHILTLLRQYNEAHGIFSTDEEKQKYIESVSPLLPGKPSYHIGWLRICDEAKAKPAIKKSRQLYTFVTKEVQAFVQASHEVQIPMAPDTTEFWPQLAEGTQWETISTGPGNQLRVTLRVPDAVEGEPVRRNITVTLRGHLPFTAGGVLETPLDVKSGVQFRPNRTLEFQTARNKQSRKTYLKLQSLRLIKRGERLVARISAAQMTEVPRDATVTKQFALNIKPGERVAVMHLCPGGSTLCNLMVFQKQPGAGHAGWTHVPLSEIVSDIRKASYQTGNGKRTHVTTQRQVQRAFLTLNDFPYAQAMARLELTKRQRTAGNKPDENTETLREFGRMKTAGTDSHYKQVAARIANICLRNNVAYALIAPGGRLYSRIDAIQVLHPTKKLFSVSTSSGSLVNAFNKAGVTALVTRSKAAPIWVKPFVLHGDLQSCQPGSIPALPGDTENRPKDWRNRKRMATPNNNESVAYPLNAGWAILLDHQLSAFRAHVDLLLAKLAPD